MNKRLKKLVKKDGRSQRQLAKDLGVSEPTLSSWLHGRRKPTIAQLDVLYEAFGVDGVEQLGYRVVMVESVQALES